MTKFRRIDWPVVGLQIESMAKDGSSLQAIAQTLNISVTSVLKYYSEHGLKTQHKRKYSSEYTYNLQPDPFGKPKPGDY